MNKIQNNTEFFDDGIDWALLIGEPRDKFYTSANTLHYQVFDYVPDYVREYAKKNFHFYALSTMKQMPGQFIPNHTDKYYYFKNKYNLETTENIVRYCVMLQDWQPGHYFEIDGKPWTNWKRGEYCILKTGIPHRSANAGSVPKYTSQITGILK